MSSLFHNQSITISEASIYFYSHYYKNLVCKIIENETCIVISSQLINNCLQTNFNINRDLEDFRVELFHNYQSVGVYSFTYEDLDKAIERDQNRKSSLECSYFSKRKYIKFKKENDCCSLYFTIQSKDFLRKNEFDVNEGFLYQQFLRNLSQKVYKKLQRKALHRIKKTEQSILCQKRKSMIEVRQSGSHYGLLKNGLKEEQKRNMIQENQDVEHPNFSKSCMNSLDFLIEKQKKGVSNHKSSYFRLKNEYKMKKLKQKAKKMFSPAAGMNSSFKNKPLLSLNYEFHRSEARTLGSKDMSLIGGPITKIPLNLQKIKWFNNENIVSDNGWISAIEISKQNQKQNGFSQLKSIYSCFNLPNELKKPLCPLMATAVPPKYESEYKFIKNKRNRHTETKRLQILGKKDVYSRQNKIEHPEKILFENAVKFK